MYYVDTRTTYVCVCNVLIDAAYFVLYKTHVSLSPCYFIKLSFCLFLMQDAYVVDLFLSLTNLVCSLSIIDSKANCTDEGDK